MKKINAFNANSANTGNGLMTAQEFVQKYLKETNFEEYAEGLRKTEIDDFRTFFECVRYGLRMADRNAQGIDRAGKPYKFYSFIRARATTGVKIFPLGDWDTFINDYQNGDIRIGFTVEDLAEAALNG
jgi:hypothetical protein